MEIEIENLCLHKPSTVQVIVGALGMINNNNDNNNKNIFYIKYIENSKY